MYSKLTLQDCLNIYEKGDKVTIINNGNITDIREERNEYMSIEDALILVDHIDLTTSESLQMFNEQDNLDFKRILRKALRTQKCVNDNSLQD